MAKKFCPDHKERSPCKPQCASCSNARDGSHAAMIKEGVVKIGRLSNDVIKLKALKSISSDEEEYW